MVQKFLLKVSRQAVEFRNANHSTAKSRNSGSKVEWKDNFQEKIFENLGIPCEVVVFFGNFGKCCSIRYWKLPKIQTRRLVEWKAPNIYPFLMPHRTTVSTGRTLRHRLTMKVFQWNTWSLIWLTCTEANNYSNLVTRPKKCSANTLVLPHGSGAISEACLILCA